MKTSLMKQTADAVKACQAVAQPSRRAKRAAAAAAAEGADEEEAGAMAVCQLHLANSHSKATYAHCGRRQVFSIWRCVSPVIGALGLQGAGGTECSAALVMYADPP